MKILLAAINAKYIHSNLAVYCLKGYCKEYEDQIEIVEFTINNQLDAIIAGIYKEKPDFIGFSCYIWNINMVYELVKELHKVLPNTKIWVGGPEVSYDAIHVLNTHPYIDGVMIGEGEETFHEVMQYMIDNKGELKDIAGIAYRKDGVAVTTAPREIMDLTKVPFPYEKLENFQNKIIYYETSRGCPYTCSYCLSSVEKKVRLRDVEKVKKELKFFLDQKVVQVKFVDRTFNCNPDHTMAIWEFIHEHDNGITNFHFEVSADILRDREIELLNKMRPGLVQLEIGVQSTNEETITAIRRKMDLTKLRKAVDGVKKGKNVHQHLDLIIGLPYEDYATFRNSFNEVYDMEPDQLQIGFLKVLKGSYMHECCEKYEIVYKDTAPYEVLYTKWITFDDVLRLKGLEDMVEVYYNSGQFINAVKYLEHFFETPFDMYTKLADYYEKNQLFDRNHSRIQRFYILLEFYKEEVGQHVKEFKEILTYDCYLREKMKSRPDFAAQEENDYKTMMEELQAQEDKLCIAGYEDVPFRKLVKVVHIEKFTIDVERTAAQGEAVYKAQVIVFDYNHRNPLNHDATTYVVNR
ncbi:MAG: B12-binding domain-containing radical SAM protein [bacterium]|nr:B12-binding domain-containing radical SAM protein [bacterium]